MCIVCCLIFLQLCFSAHISLRCYFLLVVDVKREGHWLLLWNKRHIPIIEVSSLHPRDRSDLRKIPRLVLAVIALCISCKCAVVERDLLFIEHLFMDWGNDVSLVTCWIIQMVPWCISHDGCFWILCDQGRRWCDVIIMLPVAILLCSRVKQSRVCCDRFRVGHGPGYVKHQIQKGDS